MRNAVRPLVAVIAALALNLLLARVIAQLNQGTSRPKEAPVSALRLVPLEEREELPVQDVPVVLEDEPPPLTVDLDALLPEPVPIELDPFVPDLALPSVPQPVVSVSVLTRPVVEPENTAPVELTPDTPLRAERIDEPPRELASNPQPVYPRTALRRRIGGDVKVELLIDEQGRVVEATVLEGDALLVRAVLDVIDAWRFTPPRHRGAPVLVRGLKTFSFELPAR